MVPQSKQPRLPLSEISEALERGVDAADLIRAAGLRGLQRIRAAKIISLQREHARLSQTLGAEHPRVAMLAEKLKADRALVQQLTLEARRAATRLLSREKIELGDPWLCP